MNAPSARVTEGVPTNNTLSLSRYEACPSVSRPAHSFAPKSYSSPYWSHSLVSGDKRLCNRPRRGTPKSECRASQVHRDSGRGS